MKNVYFQNYHATTAMNPDQGKQDFIKITLDYELGGINYFSGKVNERGLYLYFTKVTCNTRSASGFVSESFEPFNPINFKILLKPLAKKSDKAAQAIADTLTNGPAIVEIISKLAEKSDREQIVAILKANQLISNN